MSEVTIFSFKDEPKSQFQKDLLEFFKEYQFYHCKEDDDGELIMYDINPYRSIEFIKGCQKRITWEDLQNRYDEGER